MYADPTIQAPVQHLQGGKVLALASGATLGADPGSLIDFSGVPAGSELQSTQEGLTAATTQTQGGGTPITASFVRFTTVANNGDAATLPPSAPGRVPRLHQRRRPLVADFSQRGRYDHGTDQRPGGERCDQRGRGQGHQLFLHAGRPVAHHLVGVRRSAATNLAQGQFNHNGGIQSEGIHVAVRVFGRAGARRARAASPSAGVPDRRGRLRREGGGGWRAAPIRVGWRLPNRDGLRPRRPADPEDADDADDAAGEWPDRGVDCIAPDGVPAKKIRLFFDGGPADGVFVFLLHPPAIVLGDVLFSMAFDGEAGRTHVYERLAAWQEPADLAADAIVFKHSEVESAPADADAAGA